jgi:DNA repair exonuclease SbcCD ATPase subunit
MPRLLNERQSLEQERAELPRQIAACWQELENGSPHRARRELLEWQIRKAEKRLAEVEVRLAIIAKGSESESYAPSPRPNEV